MNVSPRSPLVAVVAGHSFVSGLDQHLRNGIGIGASAEAEFAKELKVQNRFEEVFMVGRSGGMSMQNVLPAPALAFYRPAVVLLQFSSNERVRFTSPEKTARYILDLAETVGMLSGAVVGIMSPLLRTANLGNITAEQFAVKRQDLELRLKRRSKVSKGSSI